MPDNEPYGTCDWGDCDEIAVRWRYESQLDEHLAVCYIHSEEAQINRMADVIREATERLKSISDDFSVPVGFNDELILRLQSVIASTIDVHVDHKKNQE